SDGDGAGPGGIQFGGGRSIDWGARRRRTASPLTLFRMDQMEFAARSLDSNLADASSWFVEDGRPLHLNLPEEADDTCEDDDTATTDTTTRGPSRHSR
ncbi:unnamed protein product, partial [Heterosigma akashiwo]